MTAERDRLLAAVSARVDRCYPDPDFNDVGAPDVLRDLEGLLTSVADPAADLDVAHAAGWLYWCRYLAPEPGGRISDKAAAMALLAAVYPVRPEAVPDELRAAFIEHGDLRAFSYFGYVREGERLLHRAQSTDDPQVLVGAIALLRAAHAIGPRGDQHNRAIILSNLAHALYARFTRSGDAGDLNDAIEAGHQAIVAAGDEHPYRLGLMSNLGTMIHERFEHTGKRRDLDEAVALLSEAAERGRQDPAYAAFLTNLGMALQSRFELSSSSADRDAAIDTFRHAVSVSAAGNEKRVAALSRLGALLTDRFERIAQQADLDAAIESFREAIASASVDDPERATYLVALGAATAMRSTHTGSPSDLDAAIQSFYQSVDTTRPSDPALRIRLESLAEALRQRFKRTRAPADIDAALDAQTRAVDACAGCDRDEMAETLMRLGGTLWTQVEHGDKSEAANDAIDAMRRATALTSPGHPDLARRLSDLGGALAQRFKRTGVQRDIDEAIDAWRNAVAIASVDEAERAKYLTGLGGALGDRFRHTGNRDDLDASIDTLREAAARASTLEPSASALALSNLGSAVRARFSQTGVLSDVEEAVQNFRRAVATAPSDDSHRGMYLSNLGQALSARFSRTQDYADAAEAVEVLRRAVDATPFTDPSHGVRLSNLAHVLESAAELSGSVAHAEEAVTIHRRAVEATPSGHTVRPLIVGRLGVALRGRFASGGAARDLDEAVELLREAIAAAPASHPDRAAMLLALGTSLQARFVGLGAVDDLEEGLAAFSQATRLDTAAPVTRAMAARAWGSIAAMGERWGLATEGYSAAVELLGTVAPRSLLRRDQEHHVSMMSGLGPDAAACCLMTGAIERAVELWEQGRGVLLGQALGARTALTDLNEQHPDLAERFIALRDALDVPEGLRPDVAGEEPDEYATPLGAIDAVRDRQKLADEFDVTVTEIRSQEGFNRFLLSPLYRQLAPIAIDGPIVLVNVSDLRSDAIVVTVSGVEPVALPAVTPDQVAEHVAEFMSALEATDVVEQRETAEQRLKRVLAWLWDAVAGPVLERLDLAGLSNKRGQLPRVWWCPSGPLAFLPLHAAGHHDTRFDDVPLTVLDRVVSSYTPTLRALLHARRAESLRRPRLAATRVMVVAMPKTPGQSDLPGVAEEAELLQGMFGAHAALLQGREATHEAIRARLPHYPCAHFACHGSSDPADPSASHLLLHDHEMRPFTVVDVTRIHLEQAELAYLSACSTAQTGAQVPDEAIHLASAFQLAGYRNVIATLWPIDDQAAVRIASDVYGQLIAGASSESVAHALHTGIRNMRAKLPDHPSVWAAHIHAGA
jgi:tetratricopeptide (TPR) repeat protein